MMELLFSEDDDDDEEASSMTEATAADKLAKAGATAL